MATIKAIEGRSVHQIQSGQVIIDLCSVVKELVENGVDAGASSIDVRFKNQGLESIEVQDNGSGVLPADYETIALKHYTSKLSSYDDLSALNTFGFRGEALSSLCALSKFSIITARDDEAPKGTRLDFEASGKLVGTSVAACPKGTTVCVESLFHNLPVRRKELEKNIKREYGKVLSLLHAYACISVGVKFTISSQANKGKRAVVFSTRANTSTRDNIANVYGAKTLSALIPLDLRLALKPTGAPSSLLVASNASQQAKSNVVAIHGHISKPVFGEGRQTPDRQMFYVNSRPCSLPQVSKAFNEVYKSFNITQSPFIFADLQMDTNAYDVNVSPDKRTILLHEQTHLLESLKEHLAHLFERQEQTVPQSQTLSSMLPLKSSATPQLSANNLESGENRSTTRNSEYGPMGVTAQYQQMPERHNQNMDDSDTSDSEPAPALGDLVHQFAARNTVPRRSSHDCTLKQSTSANEHQQSTDKAASGRDADDASIDDSAQHTVEEREDESSSRPPAMPLRTQDLNVPLASQKAKSYTSNDDTARSTMAAPKDDSIASPTTRSPFNMLTETSALSTPASRLASLHSAPQGLSLSMEPVRSIVRKRRRYDDLGEGQLSEGSRRPSSFARTLRSFAAPGSASIARSSGTQMSNDDIGSFNELQAGGDAAEIQHDGDESASDEARSTAGDEDRGDADSDDSFVDESEHKAREEARVVAMVEAAERAANRPSPQVHRRAANSLKRTTDKDSTFNLVGRLDVSLDDIQSRAHTLRSVRHAHDRQEERQIKDVQPEALQPRSSAEEKLSLTVSKSDFAEMRIVGQFNLGFILAVRSPSSSSSSAPSSRTGDELFIIDQHASDEIFNFHRLSATTTLTPQPLVRPHTLQLTAIEEETVITHKDDALLHNGFKVTFDDSGASPTGQRCKLLTLPTSRETVFDLRDLEELLVLLADVPAVSSGSDSLTVSDDDDDRDDDEAAPTRAAHRRPARNVPRPSRVRRMLAMRACRSSIMVGRELDHASMERVVRHMGQIERPWNCPHGRPTMRHVAGLDEWEGGWSEEHEWRDTGVDDDDDHDGEVREVTGGGAVDWAAYSRRLLRARREESGGRGSDGGEEGDEAMMDAEDARGEGGEADHDDDDDNGRAAIHVGDAEVGPLAE